MSKITKDNKGITLVALIITVILMLILVSITTYSGINTYKNAQVTKFVTQMQLLQTKVDSLISSKEINRMELQSLSTQEQQNTINYAFNNGEITTKDINKYKVITKNDIVNVLDVEDAQNEIMVNIETREIVSLIGIEYDGKTYYTQYKLPNGQTVISNDNSVQRELAFAVETSIDGLNCDTTIKHISITNGTISFAETDSYGNKTNWQTITNYTDKENEYKTNISKSGNYTFKLQDNTDGNYTEKTMIIILTNKPKTNIDVQTYNYGADSNLWAYVQKDGVSYVWIPRFVYRTNSDTNSTEIKFIKGNSNIASDNTYINNEWTLHNKFTAEDGTRLTGVWINVDSIHQEGLNMINLLNDNSKTILTTI